MTDPFVDRITRARTDKGETVSGRMVETRSQKSSGERKAMLEVEVHTDRAMNENQDAHGPEGRDRRLASDYTPVEQGHDFATSIGTLDREEMSELSDISTEMSIRMSELERAVHNESESLREEINRNRQEVGRSEKHLKERTDEHIRRVDQKKGNRTREVPAGSRR